METNQSLVPSREIQALHDLTRQVLIAWLENPPTDRLHLQALQSPRVRIVVVSNF